MNPGDLQREAGRVWQSMAELLRAHECHHVSSPVLHSLSSMTPRAAHHEVAQLDAEREQLAQKIQHLKVCG